MSAARAGIVYARVLCVCVSVCSMWVCRMRRHVFSWVEIEKTTWLVAVRGRARALAVAVAGNRFYVSPNPNQTDYIHFEVYKIRACTPLEFVMTPQRVRDVHVVAELHSKPHNVVNILCPHRTRKNSYVVLPIASGHLGSAMRPKWNVHHRCAQILACFHQ